MDMPHLIHHIPAQAEAVAEPCLACDCQHDILKSNGYAHPVQPWKGGHTPAQAEAIAEACVACDCQYQPCRGEIWELEHMMS